MRVNIYAEEMTDRVEVVETVSKNGETFTGIRFYIYTPVSYRGLPEGEKIQGPFLHSPDDDDSSAITFWSKRKLREALLKALALLEELDAKRTEFYNSIKSE